MQTAVFTLPLLEKLWKRICRTKAGFRWTKYQAASLKLRLTLGLYEIFFRNSVNVFDDQAELKKKKIIENMVILHGAWDAMFLVISVPKNLQTICSLLR